MGTNLDEKDWQILALLQDHGEYTTREIAKKAGLPITTVHTRIKKLQEQKVIRKFTVELDSAKIGRGFAAYVLIHADLHVLKQRKKSQHDLAMEIRKIPSVERVDIVSGDTDLIAFVRVRDVDEFDEVLLGKLQLIEGIVKTQSLIVIDKSRI